MPSPLVKICGITRLQDGLAALEAGADLLGFIRWPGSARFQPIEECASLIAGLRAASPRPFKAVGVYVDAPAELIRTEHRHAGLDIVQYHGAEAAEFIAGVGLPAIKAIKIKDADSIRAADDFPGLDLLTDAADPLQPGGTGRRYDPALLGDLAARRRVFVAGGLNPDNAAEVVRRFRPYGLDVSSGVEAAPGIKDREKVERFLREARRERDN